MNSQISNLGHSGEFYVAQTVRKPLCRSTSVAAERDNMIFGYIQLKSRQMSCPLEENPSPWGKVQVGLVDFFSSSWSSIFHRHHQFKKWERMKKKSLSPLPQGIGLPPTEYPNPPYPIDFPISKNEKNKGKNTTSLSATQWMVKVGSLQCLSNASSLQYSVQRFTIKKFTPVQTVKPQCLSLFTISH